MKNPGGHTVHLGSAISEPGVLVNLPGGHPVCAMHASVLLLEAKALKSPGAHISHLGCLVTEPPVSAYCPGGHLTWAVQESVLMLLLDALALKNPSGHVSHSGWEVTVPGCFVYLPGGHLVWAAHHSKGQSVYKSKISYCHRALLYSCEQMNQEQQIHYKSICSSV